MCIRDRHCTVCGYEAEAQLEHIHKGIPVMGREATCTEAGSKAYYICGCGMSFEDEECTRPVSYTHLRAAAKPTF